VSKLAAKRVVDLVLSFLGLIIFMPIMISIVIAILFFMDYPVIYTQLRPGKDGKPFRLYKFRTLSEQKDAEGEYLPDEKRLTSLGVFLRRYSLDELPELWNVIKGDLSIVGPRPLLMEYLDFYSPEQARRHTVKPGITGWAQINGRNAITWQEKFNHDIWYVDNWSLLLDLKIIILTLIKVLKREGITAEGHSTMPEFRGNIK